jgi:hypothetical protein
MGPGGSNVNVSATAESIIADGHSIVTHAETLVNADQPGIHGISGPVDALGVIFRDSLQVERDILADKADRPIAKQKMSPPHVLAVETVCAFVVSCAEWIVQDNPRSGQAVVVPRRAVTIRISVSDPASGSTSFFALTNQESIGGPVSNIPYLDVTVTVEDAVGMSLRAGIARRSHIARRLARAARII